MKIPDIVIINKIIEIRGVRVMIDRDLAELYEVPTKRLNEQVKRNLKRFPTDFMFQLNNEEKEWVIQNFEHLGNLKFSSGLPYAFTEHGSVMLSSVLNSDRAIEVNIQVVRVFTEIRRSILDSAELRLEMEKIKKTLSNHDKHIVRIFDYLDKFIRKKQKPRKKIGYKN